MSTKAHLHTLLEEPVIKLARLEPGRRNKQDPHVIHSASPHCQVVRSMRGGGSTCRPRPFQDASRTGLGGQGERACAHNKHSRGVSSMRIVPHNAPPHPPHPTIITSEPHTQHPPHAPTQQPSEGTARGPGSRSCGSRRWSCSTPRRSYTRAERGRALTS